MPMETNWTTWVEKFYLSEKELRIRRIKDHNRQVMFLKTHKIKLNYTYDTLDYDFDEDVEWLTKYLATPI